MSEKEQMDRINKMANEYSIKLAVLTKEALSLGVESFQAMTEAISYEAGYLDGLACLAGVTRTQRTNSKTLFYNQGKKNAYDDHVRVCTNPNCAAAKDLKLEIEGN